MASREQCWLGFWNRRHLAKEQDNSKNVSEAHQLFSVADDAELIYLYARGAVKFARNESMPGYIA